MSAKSMSLDIPVSFFLFLLYYGAKFFQSLLRILLFLCCK